MLEPWLFDRDTKNATEWAADSYPDISENSIPHTPTCCEDNDAREPFASTGRGGHMLPGGAGCGCGSCCYLLAHACHAVPLTAMMCPRNNQHPCMHACPLPTYPPSCSSADNQWRPRPDHPHAQRRVAALADGVRRCGALGRTNGLAAESCMHAMPVCLAQALHGMRSKLPCWAVAGPALTPGPLCLVHCSVQSLC